VPETLEARFGASRQKYWKELNEKEKIERTREVVNRLLSRLEVLNRQLGNIIEHKHNAEGKAVVEKTLHPQISEDERPKEQSDGVYF